MQNDQGTALSQPGREYRQTLLNQTCEGERVIEEETGKRGTGLKGTWDGAKCANMSSGEGKCTTMHPPLAILGPAQRGFREKAYVNKENPFCSTWLPTSDGVFQSCNLHTCNQN